MRVNLTTWEFYANALNWIIWTQGLARRLRQAPCGSYKGARPMEVHDVSDSLVFICKVSDLAPGSVQRVEHGESGLAVYNIEGTFYVTDDRCTHGLASLSEGALMGDEIECAMHFGSFHVPSGKPLMAPCSVALRTYPVIMRGEEVYADLS